MKKLLCGLLLLVLSIGIANADVKPLIYDFGGLNTSAFLGQDNQFSRLTNFWYTYPDRNSRSFIGLSKVPKIAGSITTLPVAGRGRGITQFFYQQQSDLSNYMISAHCVTDYATAKLYFNSSTMESTLGNAFTCLPYHFSFEQNFDVFRGTDTLYMANGDSFKKYFRDNASNETIVSNVYDTDRTALPLSGTYTFTQGSSTVTSSATLDAKMVKGAWIKINSPSTWYEVSYVASSGAVVLRNPYTETTTSSAGALVSDYSNLCPRYQFIWKSRLWMANFPSSATSARVGTAVVGTAVIGASSGYRQQTLACSNLLTSARPWAYESHSDTTNTGYIFVGSGTPITALTGTANYFFIFKEKEYIVYQYNDSVMPPISEISHVGYGCVGNPVVVDNYVIYFTGKEVRKTDGFTDTKISGDIDFDLKQLHYYDNDYTSMYSLSETDNYLPTAVYDRSRNFYILFIQPRNSSFTRSSADARYGYVYDVSLQKWIGIIANYNIGNVINYQNIGNNDTWLAFNQFKSGNSIYYMTPRLNYDNSNAGIIESKDLVFGDAKNMKQINWVEFWVHRGTASTLNDYATLSFDYYKDGALALASPLSTNVYPMVTDGSAVQDTTSQIQKVRFNVNTICSFFRWRLRDTAWNSGATNGLGIIGGMISYQLLNTN